MGAKAKTQMWIGRSFDIETIRIFENPLIPIRGRIKEANGITGANGCVTELVVLSRGA